MHVGDRIIAISGESIEGKRLQHAMRLLQQSTDSVTLKVSRTIDPLPTGGFGSDTCEHLSRLPFIYFAQV